MFTSRWTPTLLFVAAFARGQAVSNCNSIENSSKDQGYILSCLCFILLIFCIYWQKNKYI